MPDGNPLVDEVEETVKSAANGSKVTVIRIAVGKQVSVPTAKLAAELHRRFPGASIELKQSAIIDSIVVKDIEVE
ncbi:MAG: hypothetical protein WCT52_03125 [Candidatus Micrarchaeia archaeon]